MPFICLFQDFSLAWPCLWHMDYDHYGNLWEENLWKSMEIYGNLWKSMEIYGNLWKSNGNLWNMLDLKLWSRRTTGPCRTTASALLRARRLLGE